MQKVGSNIYAMRNQRQALGVECPLCKNRRVFQPDDLVKRSNVGDMASLARLVRLMRCSTCGARDPDSTLLDDDEAAEWLGDAQA